MSIAIREAREDDLQAVLDLYAELGDGPGHQLTLEEARAQWAQFQRYPSYRLFVACDEHRPENVLGSYALLVMHNLAHRGAPSAVVEDVVVSPACQGQGIGRRMMAHAVQLARDAGCYKLALSSNLKRTGAHAFYESLGFAQHGLSFVIEPSA